MADRTNFDAYQPDSRGVDALTSPSSCLPAPRLPTASRSPFKVIPLRRWKVQAANLGYGTIGMSVAVKFDLYSNAGEGTDSTGLYQNGVKPAMPAVMTSCGVDLHSGYAFSVHIVYDGTNLTVTSRTLLIPL